MAVQYGLPARAHFFKGGGHQFKGGQLLEYVMRIKRLHGGHVSQGGIPNIKSWVHDIVHGRLNPLHHRGCGVGFEGLEKRIGAGICHQHAAVLGTNE